MSWKKKDESMREIGRVKLVQIQRRSLKFGEKPQRYYDPAPLLVVEGLQVTPEGCIGLMEDGERIVDKHHKEHQESGYIGGNGISLEFTGHYERMREKFGEHLEDGCAGENILIESEGVVHQLEDLGERVWIESARTGERMVLKEIASATPCVQFSCYAIDYGRKAYNPEIAKEQIKGTLQFLSDGMRGFYASLEEVGGEGIIRAGDRVYTE